MPTNGDSATRTKHSADHIVECGGWSTESRAAPHKPRSVRAWRHFWCMLMLVGLAAILVVSLDGAELLVGPLYASAALVSGLVTLLVRALYVSRKEVAMLVTRTRETTKQHPGNSPETLY